MSMPSRRQLASRVFAFVMAGGRGERLYPLTEHRAKPLVSIGGSYRLIDFTLSNCFNSGLQHISVLAQYQSALVHEYVREAAAAMELRNESSGSLACVSPSTGRIYSGTADAVYQNLHCLDQTQPDYVVILSSDHVYSMDYLDMVRVHAARGSELTIAGIECALQSASHFGVLETGPDSRVTGFEEKPAAPRSIPLKPNRSLVSMGVYVFNTETLRRILVDDAERQSRHDFGRNIIPALVRDSRVSVYNFSELGRKLGTYWRDVGTIDSYFEANMEILGHRRSRPSPAQRWPMYTAGSRPVSVSRSLFVRDSLVTNDVSMESDAQVIHSVLSPRVSVGGQAHIQDSILMPGVRVGRGARICRAIIDENVQVPDGAQIGFDLNRDRRIGFVTESGIVVIPANARFGREIQEYPFPLETTVAAIEPPGEFQDRKCVPISAYKVGIDR